MDGLSGQHRFLGQYTEPIYGGVMFLNEWLAVLVIVCCIALLWRRNIMKSAFRGDDGVRDLSLDKIILT